MSQYYSLRVKKGILWCKQFVKCVFLSHTIDTVVVFCIISLMAEGTDVY